MQEVDAAQRHVWAPSAAAAVALLAGFSPEAAHAHAPIADSAPPLLQDHRPPIAQLQALPPPRLSDAAPRMSSTASQATDALQRLKAAEAAIDTGDFNAALANYTFIVKNYEDLALAEYARIGQALCLYQVGRVSDALLLLEDEEVSLRGAAQVHAALAALLYTERPSLLFRAEEEWDVSQEFDKRYSDVEWVRMNKHWPPRALDSLQRFLQLR